MRKDWKWPFSWEIFGPPSTADWDRELLPFKQIPRLIRALSVGRSISPADDRHGLSALRMFAAQRLGRSGDKSAVEPLLAAFLDPISFHYEESLRVAEALGNLGAQQAVRPITEFLNSRKDLGREGFVTVAKVLCQIGDPTVIETLLRRHEQYRNEYWHLKLSLTEALSNFGPLKLIPPVTAAVDRFDVGDYFAFHCIEAALGSQPSVVSLDFLLSAVETGGLVGAVAANYLGHTGDHRATPYLISAVSAWKDEYRSIAANALGILQDRRALPALMDSLDDPISRETSTRAIKDIGDSSCSDILIERLHEKVTAGLAGTLSLLRDKRAIEPLLAWAQGEGENQPIAASALGEFGEPGAVDALIRFLDAPSWAMRLRAAMSLSVIFKQRSVDESALNLIAAQRTKMAEPLYFAAGSCQYNWGIFTEYHGVVPQRKERAGFNATTEGIGLDLDTGDMIFDDFMFEKSLERHRLTAMPWHIDRLLQESKLGWRNIISQFFWETRFDNVDYTCPFISPEFLIHQFYATGLQAIMARRRKPIFEPIPFEIARVMIQRWNTYKVE